MKQEKMLNEIVFGENICCCKDRNAAMGVGNPRSRLQRAWPFCYIRWVMYPDPKFALFASHIYFTTTIFNFFLHFPMIQNFNRPFTDYHLSFRSHQHCHIT